MMSFHFWMNYCLKKKKQAWFIWVWENVKPKVFMIESTWTKSSYKWSEKWVRTCMYFSSVCAFVQLHCAWAQRPAVSQRPRCSRTLWRNDRQISITPLISFKTNQIKPWAHTAAHLKRVVLISISVQVTEGRGSLHAARDEQQLVYMKEQHSTVSGAKAGFNGHESLCLCVSLCVARLWWHGSLDFLHQHLAASAQDFPELPERAASPERTVLNANTGPS